MGENFPQGGIPPGKSRVDRPTDTQYCWVVQKHPGVLFPRRRETDIRQTDRQTKTGSRKLQTIQTNRTTWINWGPDTDSS